jgi:PAS fold
LQWVAARKPCSAVFRCGLARSGASYLLAPAGPSHTANLSCHHLAEVEAAAEVKLARLLGVSRRRTISCRPSSATTSRACSAIDPNFWRERVHPEDLARVEAKVGDLFKEGKHAIEYRFRRKDGSYCWVNDERG